MNIIENFEQLTPEQQQQTLLFIQKQGLDAFLADVGRELSAEEKTAAQEYFKAAKIELSDEEMEAATGGASFRQCPHGHFEFTCSTFPSSVGRSTCEYSFTFTQFIAGKKYYPIICTFFNPLKN